MSLLVSVQLGFDNSHSWILCCSLSHQSLINDGSEFLSENFPDREKTCWLEKKRTKQKKLWMSPSLTFSVPFSALARRTNHFGNPRRLCPGRQNINSCHSSTQEGKQIVPWMLLYNCNFRLESISKWLPLHDYCYVNYSKALRILFYQSVNWRKVKLWKRIGSWVNKRFSQRHLLSSSKKEAQSEIF